MDFTYPIFWCCVYFLVFGFDIKEKEGDSPIMKKLERWAQPILAITAILSVVLQAINTFVAPSVLRFTFCFAVLLIVISLFIYYILDNAMPKSLDVTIPASSWVKDTSSTQSANGYIWCARFRSDIIRDNMIPSITLLPDSLPIADEAMLSCIAETENGALLVFATNMPKADINASLVLTNAKHIKK